MFQIKVERHEVGLVQFLCNKVKRSEAAVNVYYDDSMSVDWCGDVPINVDVAFKSIQKDMKETDYNGMYKFISGCKEYTHHSLGYVYGVFHRDGKVYGWFCYKEGDDKKTQGKFYIVPKKAASPFNVNQHLNAEYSITVLGVPQEPVKGLQNAWLVMEKCIKETIEKDGGISAMLLYEFTWASDNRIPTRIWTFEKLRDYANDMGWIISQKTFTA